jgi:hypothetical protein
MALADTARLISSLELQDKFSATAAKYERTLGSMERKSSTLEKVGFQIGRGARSAVDNIKGFATSPLVLGAVTLGIYKVVNAASDLAESTSKATVVFEDQADEIIAWSKTSADAFGLSQQAALETAGTFGNLFTAMGIGGEASADMSTELVELAADLASFNNLDTAEVLEKLRAGIVGEAEPLRTLGVQISAVRTKAKAMELGFKEVDGQFTASQKAIANYQIIMEDTAKAQGDFARTSDGLANQQRILRANLENTAAVVGKELTPVLADMAGRLNDLLVKNQPAIQEFAKALPGAFDQLVEIGENLPWEAIGSSLQLAGKSAQILLGAFTSMPDWVQTAVLTGWGLNKFFGGAPLKIAFELFGALRGATPATPMFTKEVGIPGTGGPGAPVVGGGGLGRTLLGAAGKILGVAIAAEVGNLIGHALFFDPTVERPVKFEQSQFQAFLDNPKARTDASIIAHNLEVVDSGLDDLIGETREGRIIGQILFGEQLAILESQEATLKAMLAEAQQAGIGNLVPQNPGGTPGTPAGQRGVPKDSGAFNALELGIKVMDRNIRDALKEGDVHAARIASEQKDALLALKGEINKSTNLIIPHLGKTNSALSKANRNLEDGNARQRELAQGIREARDRIGTGFTSLGGKQDVANSRLSAIASKDFSPSVAVTVNASTSVSVSEVVRAASSLNFATSLSSQTRHGFTST